MMIEKFIPRMYKKDVFSINYDALKKKNIKLLIFDLDNTLSLVDELVPSKEIEKLINNLSKEFTIIVASNNSYQRVSNFCKALNCQFLSSSMKPTKKLTRFLNKNFNYTFNEIAIIGDQIVTDIFLGNRSKFLSILVDPKGQKDLKITSLNRFIENIIKKRINFKKGEYYEKK